MEAQPLIVPWGNTLAAPQVARALSLLSGREGPLKTADLLRGQLGSELGRRAAELHALRLQATDRQQEIGLRFLTRKGLEQTSAPEVARERARQIQRRMPGASIWDATCGLGADSLAMAAAGGHVVSSDLDPLMVSYAASNLEQAGATPRVLVADAGRPPLEADAVILDPDRRPQGTREGHPERWTPAWSRALGVATSHAGACVKLPPGVDESRLGLPPSAGLSWVSLEGELRELCVWIGDLAPRSDHARSAVCLRADGARHSLAGDPLHVPHLTPEQLQGITWIGEPDPAVMRAGLAGLLASLEDLQPIGPGIAYLGGERRPGSPLLRSWRVRDRSSLDPRRVRAMLRRHDVGSLTVKKRGHPEDADALARRFRGKGRLPGLLMVTRLERGHVAFLLDPPQPQGPGHAPPAAGGR